MRPKINPLCHPICFALPKQLTNSGWIQHTPFGLYIVDILRPKTIVELGTHTGVSYCAFCQAVNDLKIDASCYAIDTWEGDPHTGGYGSEVYQNLREHHDPLYGDFSILLMKNFDDALSDFENGSIDLLHIDGYHSFNAVSHDYYSWLPKMSDQGVILLHDTNVFIEDFGVWQLWKNIKEKHGNFEFLHGNGLGILIAGQSPPESAIRLTKLTKVERQMFRMFFSFLGRFIYYLSRIKE